MSTVRITSIEGATINVRGLDAIDGTPIIDVKPWYPDYDLPDEPRRVPEYVSRLFY